MKVAAVQHDVAWEDADTTCSRLAPRIAGAAGTGARLVVLTEMFSTGFSMAPERVAEAPSGPSATFLREQAVRHGVWLCASIPTADPSLPLPVNRLHLVAPDGALHTYDKLHPFTFGGERDHYGAGERTLTVDVEGLRCSFFVCYDLRFADDWWALAGRTDCYVIPANWPERRRAHWQALLRARAIENLAYVVGVNRVGEGGDLAYAGDSAVVDPLGEVLAGGAVTEATLVADVDPAVVADVRARFGFLVDRRTHAVPS
jgi:predicted amidohydrolase